MEINLKDVFKQYCKSGIYIIKNSEVVYIGQSVNILSRLMTHYTKPELHLRDVMDRMDNLEFEILEICESNSNVLLEREAFWIYTYINKGFTLLNRNLPSLPNPYCLGKAQIRNRKINNTKKIAKKYGISYAEAKYLLQEAGIEVEKLDYNGKEVENLFKGKNENSEKLYQAGDYKGEDEE